MPPPAVLLAALLLALVEGAASAAYAGPYIAYVDRFYQCNKSDSDGSVSFFAYITPFNKKNVNELQRLTGNFTVARSQGLDNSYWARVRMDKRRGRAWREGVVDVTAPTGACSATRENVPDFWRAVFGNSINGACVSKANWSYVFENEPVNWTMPNLSVLPYGQWRWLLKMGKGQETYLCYRAVGHTIPHPSPRG